MERHDYRMFGPNGASFHEFSTIFRKEFARLFNEAAAEAGSGWGVNASYEQLESLSPALLRTAYWTLNLAQLYDGPQAALGDFLETCRQRLNECFHPPLEASANDRRWLKILES